MHGFAVKGIRCNQAWVEGHKINLLLRNMQSTSGLSVFWIERPNLLVDSWAVETFANKSLSRITISVLRPYFTFRSSFSSMWFFILVPASGNHWLSQSRCPLRRRRAGLLAVAGGMATRRPENPPPTDPTDRHPSSAATRSAHQIPSWYGLADRFWKWMCVRACVDFICANPSGYWWFVAVTSTYHIIKLAVVKSWFGCNLSLLGDLGNNITTSCRNLPELFIIGLLI